MDGIDGIRAVEYIKEFQSHEDMTTQEVIESLYKKGNEWSHEHEYRLVYHESTANESTWKIDGDDIFLRAPVKRIILGYASEMDTNYYEILKSIKEYNDSHTPIEVTKCRLMDGKYQLTADKQFDLNAELASKPEETEKKFFTGTAPIYDGAYEISDAIDKYMADHVLTEEEIDQICQ